eukprot:4606279-Prymnesium_polylepis.1
MTPPVSSDARLSSFSRAGGASKSSQSSAVQEHTCSAIRLIVSMQNASFVSSENSIVRCANRISGAPARAHGRRGTARCGNAEASAAPSSSTTAFLAEGISRLRRGSARLPSGSPNSEVRQTSP